MIVIRSVFTHLPIPQGVPIFIIILIFNNMTSIKYLHNSLLREARKVSHLHVQNYAKLDLDVDISKLHGLSYPGISNNQLQTLTADVIDGLDASRSNIVTVDLQNNSFMCKFDR